MKINIFLHSYWVLFAAGQLFLCSDAFSVACSTLKPTQGSCRQYSAKDGVNYYQPSGGQSKTCYKDYSKPTNQTSCENMDYVWKKGDHTCNCPEVKNATCDCSSGSCFGIGPPCS